MSDSIATELRSVKTLYGSTEFDDLILSAADRIEELQAQISTISQCLSAAKDTYNHPSANAVINAIQDILEQ